MVNANRMGGVGDVLLFWGLNIARAVDMITVIVRPCHYIAACLTFCLLDADDTLRKTIPTHCRTN